MCWLLGLLPRARLGDQRSRKTQNRNQTVVVSGECPSLLLPTCRQANHSHHSWRTSHTKRSCYRNRGHCSYYELLQKRCLVWVVSSLLRATCQRSLVNEEKVILPAYLYWEWSSKCFADFLQTLYINQHFWVRFNSHHKKKKEHLIICYYNILVWFKNNNKKTKKHQNTKNKTHLFTLLSP